MTPEGRRDRIVRITHGLLGEYDISVRSTPAVIRPEIENASVGFLRPAPRIGGRFYPNNATRMPDFLQRSIVDMFSVNEMGESVLTYNIRFGRQIAEDGLYYTALFGPALKALLEDIPLDFHMTIVTVYGQRERRIERFAQFDVNNLTDIGAYFARFLGSEARPRYEQLGDIYQDLFNEVVIEAVNRFFGESGHDGGEEIFFTGDQMSSIDNLIVQVRGSDQRPLQSGTQPPFLNIPQQINRRALRKVVSFSFFPFVGDGESLQLMRNSRAPVAGRGRNRGQILTRGERDIIRRTLHLSGFSTKLRHKLSVDEQIAIIDALNTFDDQDEFTRFVIRLVQDALARRRAR